MEESTGEEVAEDSGGEVAEDTIIGLPSTIGGTAVEGVLGTGSLAAIFSTSESCLRGNFFSISFVSSSFFSISLFFSRPFFSISNSNNWIFFHWIFFQATINWISFHSGVPSLMKRSASAASGVWPVEWIFLTGLSSPG